MRKENAGLEALHQDRQGCGGRVAPGFPAAGRVPRWRSMTSGGMLDLCSGGPGPTGAETAARHPLAVQAPSGVRAPPEPRLEIFTPFSHSHSPSSVVAENFKTGRSPTPV